MKYGKLNSNRRYFSLGDFLIMPPPNRNMAALESRLISSCVGANVLFRNFWNALIFVNSFSDMGVGVLFYSNSRSMPLW